MQQLYWRLCLVMECIVLLLFSWLVWGNAAAILETLSCHGMYCFINICWLILGNAAAILETVLSRNVMFYYYLLAGTG